MWIIIDKYKQIYRHDNTHDNKQDSRHEKTHAYIFLGHVKYAFLMEFLLFA